MKNGAFAAVAIVVITIVIGFCHGYIEHFTGSLDVLSNFWQIKNAQGCTILFDDVHQRYVEPLKIVVYDVEFFIWEFKRLLNQVNVLIFHLSISL